MIKGMKTRTPRAGKIRGGIKKVSSKTGKEYPAATSYWVVPEEVAEVVGEKPVSLPIRFAADTLEEVFPQWLKAYKSGKLFCRGDGETANRSTEEGGFEEIECTPEECPLYKKGDCRPVGTLNFYVEGVKSLGVYQWDTSSVGNIQEINGAITAIQGLYGHLKGIPLWLTREKATSNGHTYYKAHLKLREPTEPTDEMEKPATSEKIVEKSQPRSEKSSVKGSEKASLVPEDLEDSENAIYEKLKQIEGGTTLDGVRALLTACFNVDYSDAGKYVIRNMDDGRRKKFLDWLNKKYPENRNE